MLSDHYQMILPHKQTRRELIIAAPTEKAPQPRPQLVKKKNKPTFLCGISASAFAPRSAWASQDTSFHCWKTCCFFFHEHVFGALFCSHFVETLEQNKFSPSNRVREAEFHLYFHEIPVTRGIFHNRFRYKFCGFSFTSRELWTLLVQVVMIFSWYF